MNGKRVDWLAVLGAVLVAASFIQLCCTRWPLWWTYWFFWVPLLAVLLCGIAIGRAKKGVTRFRWLPFVAAYLAYELSAGIAHYPQHVAADAIAEQRRSEAKAALAPVKDEKAAPSDLGNPRLLPQSPLPDRLTPL